MVFGTMAFFGLWTVDLLIGSVAMMLAVSRWPLARSATKLHTKLFQSQCGDR